MSNYEHKAREMVAKADKKLKGYSFLGGMGAKYDDAAELLESAGNNFKLAKACECSPTLFSLCQVLLWLCCWVPHKVA